ncbi:MarR family winged helix-turn-helix transcriptional regulator [Paractinoplanes rhizophilus]|jgi:DNA-binding MarR family transcriptional regulator|uniref:MarR family winged helix-turn-helix transcriptional regulator n=1 Tax=Paractinoplanes rhizophilus TaxID=1416877 RepID=A0ABW2I1K2_9ACTN|nr:MarR family transcriptional regulator [Actinoplanes sp.]
MTQTPPSAIRAAGELRTVFSRLRRRFREVAGVGDLTPSQTSVLSRLAKSGPATATELAAAERVRPQSMTATLAAIEQHGYLTRTPDPHDGRRQLISLSDAGAEFVEGTRRVREEWIAAALATDFTEAERQTILAALVLLDRLAEK